MKSCPTCSRTFEDSFSFCLIDGAVLSPPFDPQATKRIPDARVTKAPRTAVLPAHREVARENLPPTAPAPLPSTLPAPPPYVPPVYRPPNYPNVITDEVTSQHESSGWIAGGLLFGLVLGIIVGVSIAAAGGVISLGFFGAVVGAGVGKLISRFIQQDSESKS